MVTKEQIEKKKKKVLKELEPHKKSFETTQLAWQQCQVAVYQPLEVLIEQYFDEQLIDKNGEAVRKGMIITDGKRAFHVVDRGMHESNGEYMYNPHLIVMGRNGKRTIFPYQLKYLKIKK